MAIARSTNSGPNLFTTFPFYQRMFRASGFAEEAAKAEAGAGGASLSDSTVAGAIQDYC